MLSWFIIIIIIIIIIMVLRTKSNDFMDNVFANNF
jgi:hypothetical protein